MRELGQQLLANRALMCAISAWFVAQVLKTVVFAVMERRVNWRKLVDTGGLPSAHSALVVGLTTGIGLYEGWRSTAFAISSVFALIVMYDAIGIRQEAGKHADLLNELLRIAVIRDVYQQREELKELLGHTPLEVFAGALIGVMMALFVSAASPPIGPR
jgi:uncharacterized protein